MSVNLLFLVWLILGVGLGLVARLFKVSYPVALVLAVIMPLALFYFSGGIPDVSFFSGLYAIPVTMGAITLLNAVFERRKWASFYVAGWLFFLAVGGLTAFSDFIDRVGTARAYISAGASVGNRREYENAELIYSFFYLAISLALLTLPFISGNLFRTLRRQP
jgi:hypothetical protein